MWARWQNCNQDRLLSPNGLVETASFQARVAWTDKSSEEWVDFMNASLPTTPQVTFEIQ